MSLVALLLASCLASLIQDTGKLPQDAGKSPLRSLGEGTRHHANVVRAVDFSRDGKRCVTASWDGSAAIWNLSSAKPEKLLAEGGAMMSFAGFAKDDSLVITIANDKAIRCWSASSGKQLAEVATPLPHAFAAISPDQRLLVTQPAESGKPVELRDVETLEIVQSIDWKGALLFEVSWSPDSRYLALGSALPPRIVVWDRQTKSVVSELTPKNHLSGLAVRPDGKAVGYLAYPALHVHEFPKLGAEPIASVRGSPEPMHDFAWRDNGSVIIGDTEGQLLCIDVAAEKLIWSVSEHRDSIYDVEVSPDGKLVASASGDNTLRFWSAVDGSEQHRPAGNRDMVLCLAWSRDGKTLAAGDYGNVVARYDVASGAVRSELTHELAIAGVRIEDDGTTLSLSHAQQFQRMPPKDAPLPALIDCEDRAEMSAAASVVFRGGSALVFGKDAMLRNFDTSSGKLIDEVSIHAEAAIDLAMANDGSRIVTAAKDGTVRLSLSEGRELAILGEELAAIAHVAYAGTGIAAALDEKGTLRIWTFDGSSDEPEPKLATTLALLAEGEEEQFLDFCASPDGSRFAVIGANRIAILDAASGKALGGTAGFPGIPRCAAFSPDGKLLATGMVDGTIQVWELASLLAN